MPIPLFSQGQLQASLDLTFRQMTTRLQEWEQEALLNASEHDVTETLITAALVECPRLLRDQAWMTAPSETTLHSDQFGSHIEHRVPALTLVIPFQGERDVFILRPSSWTSTIPHVARFDENELYIVVEGRMNDAAQVRRRFEAQLDEIDRYLGWSGKQIDRHNDRVRSSVPDLVRRRRLELLEVRNLQAEIGYPIRRRADADTYSVPVQLALLPFALPGDATGRFNRRTTT